MTADPGNTAVSGRLLALLVSEDRLKRLRWMYAADAKLHAELVVLHSVLMACDDASKVDVDIPAPAASGFVSTATAARRAGVTQSAIRLAISEHRIHADRVSGRWLIPATEVDAYIRNRSCLLPTNATG